jgi:hypothetical protein
MVKIYKKCHYWSRKLFQFLVWGCAWGIWRTRRWCNFRFHYTKVTALIVNKQMAVISLTYTVGTLGFILAFLRCWCCVVCWVHVSGAVVGCVHEGLLYHVRRVVRQYISTWCNPPKEWSCKINVCVERCVLSERRWTTVTVVHLRSLRTHRT